MDDRIQTADGAARLLGDQRGTEILTALQRLALSLEPGSPATAGDWPTAEGRPGYLGMWEIAGTPAGPALHRRPRMPAWATSFWSADGDVPGKGDAVRVVLTGESVARGYLLDPVLNPAMALRHYLAAAPGGQAYQCVDLAQTSMRIRYLRHVADTAARYLDADVLVVFAGNNWTTHNEDVPVSDYPPSLAAVLRDKGYPGLRECIRDEYLMPQVRGLFDGLERLRGETGVQPIVVVPEFNLAGWSPMAAAKELDVPMLPEPDLARWYRLRSAGVAAMRQGDWAAVQTTARSMAELDHGMSPVPGYLLGRALAATGQPGAAREAFERSRDSMWGLPVRCLPRTSRVVQDTMREFCRRTQIGCVDLPQLLGSCETPELPDTAHFLDYCHLSDSGIAIAMSEVARLVLGGTESVPDPAVPLIGDWERAVSLLLAAAYNSQCGQPADVVRGYLHRAIGACPRIRALMVSLVGVLDRPGGPLWSGPCYGELTREANVASIFVHLAEYRPDKSRLWTLREALADLAGAAIASAAAPRPGSPREGQRELLDVSTTIMGLRNVPNYTEPRCYLQANTPVTEIKFVLAERAGGALRLLHRRREGSADPAAVRLNGHLLGELPPVTAWRAAEFAVAQDLTRPGVNLIEVVWTSPAVRWQTRIDEDAAALARGDQPYVLPLFGELFSASWSQRRP